MCQTDDLIAEHFEYALVVARNMTPQTAGSQIFDDLNSAALLGLMKAARRWNPKLGTFKTYLVHRVRGEVQDEMRRLDYVHRRYLRTIGEEVPESAISMEMVTTEDGATLADLLAADDDVAGEVGDAIDRAALRAPMRRALAELRPRERFAVEARYGFVDGRDWKLHEIGDHLGVTESRASQLVSGAETKLRASLAIAEMASRLALPVAA